MIFGTIVAASFGRVMYQIALTVTGGDNGFVTMFLNLVPALTAFISLALSHWVADLHFAIDLTFFLGSGLDRRVAGAVFAEIVAPARSTNLSAVWAAQSSGFGNLACARLPPSRHEITASLGSGRKR